MSFDRTNTTDLLALQSEVATDPISMGYAAVVDNTQALLDLLNIPANNVGNDTILKPIEELEIPEVAGVIDETEYSAASAYDKIWVEMLINQNSDVSLGPFVTKFLEIFPGGSTTTTAVQALRVKDASRAEILFGVNTLITRDDWIAARDYVS